MMMIKANIYKFASTFAKRRNLAESAHFEGILLFDAIVPSRALHGPKFLGPARLLRNKKFQLMLTRRAKAYSSSGSVV